MLNLIAKYLITSSLMLICLTANVQASTDTTTISISVLVKNSCQLSIGGKISESTNNCQLSEPEFAKRVALLKKANRAQAITEDDGSLSIRVSMTAP